MSGIKLILEIDSGVATIPALVGLINDRIRDLGEDLKIVVTNPSLVSVDLGGNQINNLADPSSDLDAVNLRTLKRIPAADAILQTPALPDEIGQVTFGLPTDAAGQGPNSDGTDATGYRVTALNPGVPFAGSITLIGEPTTANTVVEMLISHDKGATFKKASAAVTPATTPVTYRGFAFKPSDVGRVLFARGDFGNVAIIKGDIIRFDLISGGGATGITFEARW